jgi:hypothetical protein
MAAPASQETNLLSLEKQYAVDDMAFEDRPTPSFGAHLEDATGGTDGFTGNNPVAGTGGFTPGTWGCDSGNDAPWISPTGQQKNEPSCIPCPASLSCGPYGGAYRATDVSPVPTVLDRCAASSRSCRVYAAQTIRTGGLGWNWCRYSAKILHTNEKNNCVSTANFLTDARNNNLANVSFIYPTQATSQHNTFSMTEGDNWIGQIVAAVSGSAEWASTVIIIDWDDFGGFYDHVAPRPGHGFRVPLVVISPYARPQFTDHTVAMMAASPLAMIDWLMGFTPLGDDASAYNLSGMLNFAQAPHLVRPVMVSRPLSPAEERQLAATPVDRNDPT